MSASNRETEFSRPPRAGAESVSRTALVVFARLEEGGAKRLGLGPSGDRALGACLLRSTLASARRAARGRPILLYTDRPAPPVLAAGTTNRLQHGVGFEARLLGALQDARRLGFRRLVVVGSDTPGLRPAALRRALASPAGTLEIGPSEDGGFYLLAIDADRLDLLPGLPWCTARAGVVLRRRARSRRLPVRHARRRRDVDGPRDVLRLRALLERLGDRHLGVALWPSPAPAPARVLELHTLPARHAPLEIRVPRAPPAPRAI